ncbi:hypothetical protein FKM82_028901 [Ascaphus truei]
MKITVAFLLVTLSCYFGKSATTVQENCLTQLFEKDAPGFVKQLGNLLCNYQLAKKMQNQDIFIEFLNKVNNILEDVGCTVDDLLGTKVVPTLENAEEIADRVAVILFNFLDDLLSSVVNVLENLPPLVSDIMDTLLPEVVAVLDALQHVKDVKNLACDVMEDLLPKVATVLEFGGDILDNILNDLGLEEHETHFPL